MKEIDHEHTQEIVCPWCGYEMSDSWEVNFGPGTAETADLDCGNCEKKFRATRTVSVDYSTEKVEAMK